MSDPIRLVIAALLILAAVGGGMYLASRMSCEMSVRMDENGIVLSDPCNKLGDGAF